MGLLTSRRPLMPLITSRIVQALSLRSHCQPCPQSWCWEAWHGFSGGAGRQGHPCQKQRIQRSNNALQPTPPPPVSRGCRLVCQAVARLSFGVRLLGKRLQFTVSNGSRPDTRKLVLGRLKGEQVPEAAMTLMEGGLELPALRDWRVCNSLLCAMRDHYLPTALQNYGWDCPSRGGSFAFGSVYAGEIVSGG